MTTHVYTLVQHSGYVVGKDPSFARAVEYRGITPAVAERVRKYGGVILNTYEEADNAEYDENYPPEVAGIIPRVRGTFDPIHKIQGSPLYIPAVPAITSKKKENA